MTLLDKAKELKKTNSATSNEVVELAIAWAMDEVRYAQVCNVLGKKGSAAYPTLALALKHTIQSRKERKG